MDHDSSITSGPNSHPKIVAVANQKGGVGKTTSVINLGACLAAVGKKTLIVDLDPQCNATSGLGFETAENPSILELLLGESQQFSPSKHGDIEPLSILTGSPDLVGAEKLIAESEDSVRAVTRLLHGLLSVSEDGYDYIFLDCPPSLNLLTLNALTAATHLLVPVQAEYYALEGLAAIMESLEFTREHTNPNIELLGLAITMVDVRTNLAAQVESEIRKHYGDRVFRTTIPRNVRLSEAPSHGLPIILYDIYSRGAKAYMELTKEILNHGT